LIEARLETPSGFLRPAAVTDCLRAMQLLRVVSAIAAKSGWVKRVERGEMPDRVGIPHIVGVVRAHQHVIGAEDANPFPKLVRGEDHVSKEIA
jgi:hypothetical protein